jgi:hypothetical protein
MASTSQWPHVQEELDQHNEERTKEVDSLKGQIEIVMADLDVIAGRLKMVGSCTAPKAMARKAMKATKRAPGRGTCIAAMAPQVSKIKGMEEILSTRDVGGNLKEKAGSINEEMALYRDGKRKAHRSVPRVLHARAASRSRCSSMASTSRRP